MVSRKSEGGEQRVRGTGLGWWVSPRIACCFAERLGSRCACLLPDDIWASTGRHREKNEFPRRDLNPGLTGESRIS